MDPIPAAIYLPDDLDRDWRIELCTAHIDERGMCVESVVSDLYSLAGLWVARRICRVVVARAGDREHLLEPVEVARSPLTMGCRPLRQRRTSRVWRGEATP